MKYIFLFIYLRYYSTDTLLQLNSPVCLHAATRVSFKGHIEIHNIITLVNDQSYFVLNL